MLVLLTDGQEVTSEASLKEAIEAALDAGVAVYPIAIESPSFSPRPLKQLAKATGGRYSGAASTSALHRIYTSLAQELRRTWRLSYVTSARPGERLVLAAAGARAATVVPGTRVVVKSQPSKLPDSAFALGTPLVVSAVAGCVLLAAIFLLRAPVGTGLRRRIAPHVGKGERKSTRGPSEERFATASSLMRATESAFGHLRVWHWLHRLLERADIPLRTVELAYIAIGSALGSGLLLALFGASSLVTLLVMVAGGSVPIMFVAWKARRRLVAIDNQLPDLLITLAASLKAGHSFRQGIQAVVDEGELTGGQGVQARAHRDATGAPDGRRPRRDGGAGRLEEPALRRHGRDDSAPGRRQPRRDLRHGGRGRSSAAGVRAQDPFAHGHGPDVGLRPGRHPTLPARGHHAPEQGVHVTESTPPRRGTCCCSSAR